MMMGWYLSFFFTISHNFHGVEKHEDTTRGKKSFLFNQARSKTCIVETNPRYSAQ
jgi:hypothetical protein